jgi:hypothetical protein
MLAACIAAASLFVFVSMAANLTFGLSLATRAFDQIIYGALSLGADLMKVALPLVALILWRKKHRLFALIASAFWVGVVGFSLAAAVGFAASTRGETVTVNQTAIDSREAWMAKIERAERQLDQLGVPRPAAVIQAEIDALLRAPGADDCDVINGPVTRKVCPQVDILRKERAVADRVAELETELVAARKQLQAVPVAALMSDPQSATLSRLMLLSEAEIRDAIAFLIAAIVEIGSALGFTFMVLAGRTASGSSPPASPVPQPTAPPKMQMPISLPETPADTVARWTLARLDVLHEGRIQAERAYKDFKRWCADEGIEPCTPQMFGRRFTKIIEGMGGRKLKVNGRAYYQGVALQERPARTGQRKKITAS